MIVIPMDALKSAMCISLILASCAAIGVDSSNLHCVICLHRLKTVVLPEAPPYVRLSFSHLSQKEGSSTSDAIRE